MTLPPDAFDVVDAVYEHWIVHGVRNAVEMRDEFAEHLDAALRDGKSIADVTGPDLEEFADAWAGEAERDSPLWSVLAVVASGWFLTVAAVAAAVFHQHRLDVTVESAEVVWSLMLVGGVASLFRSRLRRGPVPGRRRTLWRRVVLLSAVMAVLAKVVMPVLDLPVIHLGRWQTLLAFAPFALLAVAVVFLDLPPVRALLGIGERADTRAEMQRRLAANREFERRWKPPHVR